MKIAILGTGLMGTAMAEAIIKAGHETIVYNRTAEKTAPLVTLGAKAAGTAAEAIKAADVTIIVLLNGTGVKKLLLTEEVRAVLQGKRLINASTTTYEEIVEIADEIAKHGGELAEMTINADNMMLRTSQAHFAVGCKTESESFWTEVLSSFSAGVQHLGDVGDATKAEAPTLVASMFSMVTLAYSAAIAQKLNVSQKVYEPIISMAVPGSEYQLPNMISRNYDQVFAALDSYTTGLKTAISAAKSAGIPTAVLEEMLKLFETADKRGFGKKDGSAVLEVLLDPKRNGN